MDPDLSSLMLSQAGGLASSLFGRLFQPETPTLQDLINPVFRGMFGGASFNLRQKLQDWKNRLEAGGLTPKQEAKLKSKIAQAEKRLQSNLDQAYASQQLSAYQKWLPQFAQLSSELNEALLPQQIRQESQFGSQLARSFYDTQRSLTPEFYALRDRLADTLSRSLGTGLTPEQSQYFSSQLAAQQAGRGLYDSPLSAVNSARSLTELDMLQRQRNLGNAQQFLNAFRFPPVPTLGLVQPQTLMGLTGSMFEPVGQRDLLGLNTSLRGLKYANRYNFLNQLASQLEMPSTLDDF